MIKPRHCLRNLLVLLAPTLLLACDGPQDYEQHAGLGNPKSGETALQQYACVTCHKIPGVVGPDAWVGPSLRHIASRTYLAGVVTNTPENMIAWLMNPKRIAPDTAMPDLGVTEAHARDIAAFLYQLE